MSIKDEITERVGIHKVALAILQEMNWLEREQPISDHGIDIQAEIVENEKPTGMLYGIQVKSGKSYFEETTDSKIVFRKGKKRHLDYWVNHSLPVILALYHPEEDKIYWTFVRKDNTEITGKNWKIEIPKTNIFSKSCKNKILDFYFNSSIFTLFKTEDTSHALSRRVSVKLLHTKEVSDITIEKVIPQFIEKLKTSDYYRNELVESHHKNKLADSIWLYTYKTLEQEAHGLPHCTAVWNCPKSESPTTLTNPDKILENNIVLKWGNDVISKDYIQTNQSSKGKYLKIIDLFIKEATKEIDRIKMLYKQTTMSSEVLRRKILEGRDCFSRLLSEEYQQSFPPYECRDLDQEIQNLHSSIDNIFIVSSDSNRDESNLMHCITMYLETGFENLNSIKYERKKVV